MTTLADFLMNMAKPPSKATSGRKGSSWFKDPFHHGGEDTASGWSYCTHIQGLEERNEGWCLTNFLFFIIQTGIQVSLPSPTMLRNHCKEGTE